MKEFVNFTVKRKKANSEEGFVLITVILFLALFAVLSMTLLYKITSTIKISGVNKTGMMRFHGAEGGAIAAAAYMSKYKRTDIPLDLLVTPDYTVTTRVLGDTIRYPVGFSSLWKGATIQINSISPPSGSDTSEVEMVVFVPISPVGYGNE